MDKRAGSNIQAKAPFSYSNLFLNRTMRRQMSTNSAKN